jgi:hypothetical protein
VLLKRLAAGLTLVLTFGERSHSHVFKTNKLFAFKLVTSGAARSSVWRTLVTCGCALLKTVR